MIGVACGVAAVGVLLGLFVIFDAWVGAEIDRIGTEEIREERGPHGEA
jgi:hypothetical protein